MLPLFLSGEAKRDYEFIWMLQPPPLNFLKSTLTKIQNLDGLSSFKKMMDSVFSAVLPLYVSQLATKITLPDDEVGTEENPKASIQDSYLNNVLLHPITVEYMEDGFNSAYIFHRLWHENARTGTSWKAPATFTMSGIYIPMAHSNASLIASGLAVAPVVASVKSTLTEIKEQTYSAINRQKNHDTSNWSIEWLEEYIKTAGAPFPTSYERWPYLYPIKITRTEGDKAGKSFAKVTVQYKRFAKVGFSKEIATSIFSSAGPAMNKKPTDFGAFKSITQK